mmetsp:Transcript_5551/g.8205  ORF Transcript_5551/g.8205 Transcript_5551/m.8205 type:complete len:203 (+) Transcript_5551:61-669(+)
MKVHWNWISRAAPLLVAFFAVRTQALSRALSRREMIKKSLAAGGSIAAVSLGFEPRPAIADLNSAAAGGLPLLGRFEPLKGAKSFIGIWSYQADFGPSGQLAFLKNGEVELRSLENDSRIIGVGAVPWKYVSSKGSDTIVSVSFTIDAKGQNDVLIFQGSLDSAAGPDRTMQGTIETGRAEIGARGGGPRTRVGSFKASFLE